MRLDWRAAAAASLLIIGTSGAAGAADLETRGDYCNDTYFDSDGAGISACINLALRYDADTIGIGIVGATPEQKGNVKNDPLESLARITGWYGREFESADDIRFAIVGHTGLQGEAADNIALDIRDALHDLFGAGRKKIVSTKPTTFVAGLSGWGRKDYEISTSGDWTSRVTPYVHAAAGNDVVEAGGGVMLALQPLSASEGLALVLPKNGAYAPTFGGDGLGLFAGVRGIAHESLYGDFTNNFIAEAGVMGQVTLWDFAVLGASASCTTEPYDGAHKADCKATLQMGGLF